MWSLRPRPVSPCDITVRTMVVEFNGLLEKSKVLDFNTFDIFRADDVLGRHVMDVPFCPH